MEINNSNKKIIILTDDEIKTFNSVVTKLDSELHGKKIGFNTVKQITFDEAEEKLISELNKINKRVSL
jgi:hypothetical protein